MLVLANSPAQSLRFWIQVLKESSLMHAHPALLSEPRTAVTPASRLALLCPVFSSAPHQRPGFDLDCFTYLLANGLLPASLKACTIHERDKSMCFHHTQSCWPLIIFLCLRLFFCFSSSAVGTVKEYFALGAAPRCSYLGEAGMT